MTDRTALIYTLFGSQDEARAVGETLILEKQVACANHLAPALSQYRWEGALQTAEEFPVLFKTTETGAASAMARLKALHSYDTPAILCWYADQTDPDYARWLGAGIEKP